MKHKKNTGENIVLGSFLMAIKILIISIFLPVVLLWFIAHCIRHNKRKTDISFFEKNQIKSLTGTEFEQLLLELFQKMGYKVELTKVTGDFGADLIISKNGKKSIIQAKRYDKTVGVRAVQEIISARSHYKIYDAYVVVSSSFSRAAMELADDARVFLIDGDALEKLLIKFKVNVPNLPKKCTAMSDIILEKIRLKYPFWI